MIHPERMDYVRSYRSTNAQAETVELLHNLCSLQCI